MKPSRQGCSLSRFLSRNLKRSREHFALTISITKGTLGTYRDSNSLYSVITLALLNLMCFLSLASFAQFLLSKNSAPNWCLPDNFLSEIPFHFSIGQILKNQPSWFHEALRTSNVPSTTHWASAHTAPLWTLDLPLGSGFGEMPLSQNRTWEHGLCSPTDPPYCQSQFYHLLGLWPWESFNQVLLSERDSNVVTCKGYKTNILQRSPKHPVKSYLHSKIIFYLSYAW